MRAASLFTTVVVSTSLTLSSTASASEPASPLAELLYQGHEILGEFEVATFVTRDHEGVLASDVNVHDMASGDELDVWTDGETVWWDGTADGVPTHGSIPAGVTLGEPGPQAHFCLTPVGALVCLAGAIAVAATEGCGYGFTCTGETPQSNPSNPPDGGGGAPAGGDSDDDDEGGGD